MMQWFYIDFEAAQEEFIKSRYRFYNLMIQGESLKYLKKIFLELQKISIIDYKRDYIKCIILKKVIRIAQFIKIE